MHIQLRRYGSYILISILPQPRHKINRIAAVATADNFCSSKENIAMKKSAYVISVMISLGCLIFLFVTGYHACRDINAVIDRAQVAADREDMLEYLKTLKTNMEKWGMTKGHFALVFTTPANDLALHYKAVNRIIERLDSIKAIPKNETAYQVALSDLRGTVRELHNPALNWLWANYWYLYLLAFATWILPWLATKLEDRSNRTRIMRKRER